MRDGQTKSSGWPDRDQFFVHARATPWESIPSPFLFPDFTSFSVSGESLDVVEAERARCGIKTIYHEFRADRLKTARIGRRRDLRLPSECIDAWLLDWHGQPAEPFNLFRDLDRRRA